MSCLLVRQRATVREQLCDDCATGISTVCHADVRPPAGANDGVSCGCAILLGVARKCSSLNSGALVGTNPTGEPITSRLPVIRPESETNQSGS